MDRDEGLALLPEDYGLALRLRDEGLPPAAIAARLGVDVDVIGTLIEIGEGKLRRILESD